MERIALIGNFPPRKCGIATFMNDLNDGIKSNGTTTTIVAMNDGIGKYNYSDEVKFEIDQNDIASYISAANYLNSSHFDVAILQHEFGIFGGRDGMHIIQLLKRLQMPVITTLHTILDTPSEGQKDVMNDIAALSKKLVTISRKGVDILRDIYGVPVSKCKHIHHGVHETVIEDTEAVKKQLGIEKEKVLLTFGLLSRNKSIEVVIKSLPEVIKKYPDLVYIVLGATHPHVIKHEGEEYRESLKKMVTELGLEDNVMFIDRFVSNGELFEFLKICDIYIIPYLGEKQISSGTLIYAMGAGKPVVSTPFWYAQEMLSENRGLLFDFNDSVQLTRQILYLLDNDVEREIISDNAFKLASQCYWPDIGKQYLDLVSEIAGENFNFSGNYQNSTYMEPTFSLPSLNLTQLRLLTDDTGILQHSRYSVPDRTYGYCIDDNARALILTVMLQNDVDDIHELNRLTSTYLSFMDYAYNPVNRKFRNFMSYNREWLEEEGSEDSTGRAMWALGYTAAFTNISNFYHHANSLFREALDNIDFMYHPRALAYLILGLVCYGKMYNEDHILNILENKTRVLSSYFDNSINNEWLWFEDRVTYANCRIPEALIASGTFLKNRGFVERGIIILDWLIEKQFNDNIFSPVGNNGWMTREKKAVFDQQPLEAHGMLDACLRAEKCMKDGKYEDYAMKAFAWFTGNNDYSSVLYDHSSGGCHDGLYPGGINLNQGAESTLSWLMSRMSISHHMRSKSNNL